MATLPSIDYGAPVQELKGVDPAVVAAEGRAFGDIAHAGADIARMVQGIITDDQVQDTTVATSREMSDWIAENRSKEYFTADEARELGVTGTNLVDGAGNDRQEIPAHEVFPEAVSIKMERMIEDQAGNITAPGARNKWTARMEQTRDKMYEKAVLDAEGTRFKHRVNKTNNDIQQSLDAGDYATAYTLAENHPVVEQREQLTSQIELAEEESGYYDVMRTNNPWDMASEAQYLRGNEYNGTMNDRQRHAWINRLEQESRRGMAQIEAANNRAIGRELAEVELAVEKGTVGQEKIEEMYQKYPNHATPDWWKRLTRKADARNQEMIEDFKGMSRVGLAVQGVGFVDPHGNPDDKKYTDMVYDQAADEIIQSGDPNAFAMTVELGTQVARTTGYVPSAVQAQFRAAYNMDFPPEQLAQLAGAYSAIQADAPGALDFMDDKHKAFMQQIVNLNRGGTPTPEAIEKFRTKMDNIPSDVLSRRNQEFAAEGKNNGHSDYLQKRISRDWGYSGIGRLNPFSSGPQAETQMAIDFENKARHYYQLTGDMDAAWEAAWGDVRSVYGTTEINGEKQLVRDSLEVRYSQIPPDKIRTDLNSFLGSAGVPKDVAKNIEVHPDARTGMELENPTYSLWYVNPDDPMDRSLLINEQTGAPIRYRPDVQRINDRDLSAELKKAQRDREYKQLHQPQERKEFRRSERQERKQAQRDERQAQRESRRAAKAASREQGQIEHVRSRQAEEERDLQSLKNLGVIQ